MWRRKACVLAAFLLLAAYLYWFRRTGIGIPCVFRLVTGLKCPGCGITTMLAALVFFDFRGAFQANPFLFVTLPFLILECGIEWHRRRKHAQNGRINQILIYGYLCLLMLFGVLRNLP
ncbi:MAG: DUF2752 domain-containing protein [Lachnospiraceae bacterium]|nr:DUF2752 domain-containing protein [Lachnospiraceae bacterium]